MDFIHAFATLFAFCYMSGLCAQTTEPPYNEEPTTNGIVTPGNEESEGTGNLKFTCPARFPRDCSEVYTKCSAFNNSGGVHVIQPEGYPHPFPVYCDDTGDEGGWTIIQRRDRSDNKVSFNRIFQDYQHGFGLISGSHWLGNEKLAFLTNQTTYELRIDVELADGSTFYVTYNLFHVGDENTGYALSLGNFSSGGNGTITTIITCDPKTEGVSCPRGFMKEGPECVPIRECQCFWVDIRRLVPLGQSAVNRDCTEKRVCENNRLIRPGDYTCSPHATCTKRDGVRGCFCNDGYTGDGQTCTPRDCQVIFNAGSTESGEYEIKPRDWPGEPFPVFCNMTAGGGWTVFQRRVDGSVDFYLGWSSYKNGFGNVQHEHWLGNEKLHYLTNQGNYDIRVDMVDSDGDPHYAKLPSFRINNEADNYRLSEALGTRNLTILSDTDCVSISSPSYPNNYADDQIIQWTFKAEDEEATLTLRFSTFDTEGDYDYVTVGSGPSTLLRASGSTVPQDVTSPGNSMWIRFESDVSGVYQGFLAVLAVDVDQCEDRPHTVGVGEELDHLGSSLLHHRGAQFSTKDRDNDDDSGRNCAADRHGAWWYWACGPSNLNGNYRAGRDSYTSISWWHLPGSEYYIKYTEMKVRPP